MSQKINESCNECGASFEVDVFSLGHREEDGLSCNCCGAIIHTVKKRTESYPITKIFRHGNLKIKYSDLEKFKGKTLRFKKGNEEFSGKVSGLSESVMATASGAIRPWLVIGKNTEYSLNPEDNWHVCKCCA